MTPMEPPQQVGTSGTIRAGGTVLWAATPAGLRVAMVHRPRRDDWSLPKGKLDPGESERDAAVRETLEETGWRGALGPELGLVRYRAGGHPKTVRYWALLAQSGAFAPGTEVDALEWLDLRAARERATYAQDREVLDRFVTAITGADEGAPRPGGAGGEPRG